MHAITVKGFPAGKCDISDHVKSGCHHLVEHVYGAWASSGDPLCRAFGGIGHDRCKVHHVAMRKHGRCGTSLPAPMRAFGDKQRLANCRF